MHSILQVRKRFYPVQKLLDQLVGSRNQDDINQ